MILYPWIFGVRGVVKDIIRGDTLIPNHFRGFMAKFDGASSKYRRELVSRSALRNSYN